MRKSINEKKDNRIEREDTTKKSRTVGPLAPTSAFVPLIKDQIPHCFDVSVDVVFIQTQATIFLLDLKGLKDFEVTIPFVLGLVSLVAKDCKG